MTLINIPELFNQQLEGDKTITYGADPEVFIINEHKTYELPHNIPGTKEKPHKVKGGYIQRDGLALEININPVTNEDDWFEGISTVLSQAKTHLPSAKYKLKVCPVARFSKFKFNSAPVEFKLIGCDPDFNAYRPESPFNSYPEDTATKPVRCAGGHIHIGWTKGKLPLGDVEHHFVVQHVVKQLDFTMGLFSVIKDERMPFTTERTKTYGEGGQYRPKPYGAEYRTPSNSWLEDEESIRNAFEYTQAGIELLKAGHYMPEILGEFSAKTIIDTQNYTEAKELLNEVLKFA